MFIIVVLHIITYERLPEGIASSILNLTKNRIVLLLLINRFMIIMGMILDNISTMLIAAPLLYPLFMSLEVHLFQMDAIMAINQGSGQMTPPVATNLLTASRVSGVPVADFSKDCLPSPLLGSLPVLIMVTFIPEISLFYQHFF